MSHSVIGTVLLAPGQVVDNYNARMLGVSLSATYINKCNVIDRL